MVKMKSKHESWEVFSYFYVAGGGAEQQPRRRPSANARAEAESDGVAATRVGLGAQAVSSDLRSCGAA